MYVESFMMMRSRMKFVRLFVVSIEMDMVSYLSQVGKIEYQTAPNGQVV